MEKPLFDSQGNIEPWGRDFWSENLIGEILIVLGIPALILLLFIAGIMFLIKLLF